MLGITGTPGTGKKSIAPVVAERLGTQCLSLNELAMSLGLVNPKSGAVDTRMLRSRLRHDLAEKAVVYGHLLPYAVPPGAVSKVVVLRCEPGVLKGRLRLRGYGPSKIVENVEAELIGVVSSDAFDTYGGAKTWEVDTTNRSPVDVAGDVVAIAVSKPRDTPRIDWTLDYDSGAKLRLLLSTAE
jgi:adenylate kinase